MTDAEKRRLYDAAKEHASSIIQRVNERRQERISVIERLKQSTKSSASANRLVDLKLLGIYQEEQEQFSELQASPYFVRCDVRFEGENELKQLYFAKFPFVDEQIFSWTSPASVIRYESTGACSYRLPDKTIRRLELLRKDQFMIVEGKILFMSHESEAVPRQLIYQEYFTQHKTDFALPEIVAQMEKAQDQVIRAAPQGSMLVSGPAGSGKTTLALHRIAFLAQSPDTASRFPAERLVVFVQDRGTQIYFSKLLPSLGIHHVEITTFDQWTLKMLKLDGYTFVVRPGNTEEERDLWEYRKRDALRKIGGHSWMKNPFDLLALLYQSIQEPFLQDLFLSQRQRKELDRFDLTVLLSVWLNSQGPFTKRVTLFDQLKNGSWKKRIVDDPIQYALILLDEVQNYLPEQIHALKKCLDPDTKSILYVGDLAQQTRLGTVRDWSEVGETFEDERKVVLQKVYRNTRQILEYVGRQGYAVSLPDGARSGEEVKEYTFTSFNDVEEALRGIIASHPRVSIGVLVMDPGLLSMYGPLSIWSDQVRLLTVPEAQGVEFDVVCLIRPSHGRDTAISLPADLEKERQHVARDLWYVAMTRAMNELHVITVASA